MTPDNPTEPVALPVGEILPCPFCGGDKFVQNQSPVNWYWVKCVGCGASSGDLHSKAAAIAAWNRRAPPSRGGGAYPRTTLEFVQTAGAPKGHGVVFETVEETPNDGPEFMAALLKPVEEGTVKLVPSSSGDGVTDEMVEAAMKAHSARGLARATDRIRNGMSASMSGGDEYMPPYRPEEVEDMRLALEAALASPRADTRGDVIDGKLIRERLDHILDEDAPNKWVWKTFLTQDEWLRESILPLLRDIRSALTTETAGG